MKVAREAGRSPIPPSGATEISNLEGLSDFHRSWSWATGSAGGVAAVMRVKNEAENLPYVLPALLRGVEQVVLVDNGSTDGTPDVAAELADTLPGGDRIEILSYPFDVARAGSEHRRTHPSSVHSLTHYYNWCFSHARTALAMKWDGDMVLTRAGEQALSALSWQLAGIDSVVSLSVLPLWVASTEQAFIDTHLTNHEPRLWRNGPGFYFVKSRNFESLRAPKCLRLKLESGLCFELKRLDRDEFGHWSSPQEFVGRENTVRKRREWAVARALRAGDVPTGLVPFSVKQGEDVIEAVRRLSSTEWHELISGRPRPQRARVLTRELDAPGELPERD